MFARTILTSLVLVTLFAAIAGAQQPPPAMGEERVAAFRQSLQASMAALRRYEWVETMVVSVKGQVKSREQNRCSYGPDGAVLRLPLGDERAGGGPGGMVVDHRTQEAGQSIQEAIGLVRRYVPPDPERVQAAKDAGRILVGLPDANGNVRVNINDYLLPGDSLVLDLDAAANRLTGVSVTSFTVKEKHTVLMRALIKTLDDGTLYPANVQLDITGERLTVAIENSGYRKTS